MSEQPSKWQAARDQQHRRAELRAWLWDLGWTLGAGLAFLTVVWWVWKAGGAL